MVEIVCTFVNIVMFGSYVWGSVSRLEDKFLIDIEITIKSRSTIPIVQYIQASNNGSTSKVKMIFMKVKLAKWMKSGNVV